MLVGEAGALQQFDSLLHSLGSAQALPKLRHIGVVPESVAFRHYRIHWYRRVLKDGLGHKLLVDYGGDRLPELLEAHGSLAGVEAQVEHAVVRVGHDCQVICRPDAVLEALLHAERVEQVVDVAVSEREYGSVLVAVYAEQRRIYMGPHFIFESLCALGIAVEGGLIIKSLVGFGISAVLILRYHHPLPSVVGRGVILEECARFPLAEGESADRRLVVRDVREQRLNLLLGVA